MVIREAPGELDISGSPAELEAIAQAIERLAPGGSLSIDADAGADPKPYQRCLAALDVRVTDGPMRVALAGDRLLVSAGAAMLTPLASYFRFDPNAVRGAHHHHDWFGDEQAIARDSLPLVISVE